MKYEKCSPDNTAMIEKGKKNDGEEEKENDDEDGLRVSAECLCVPHLRLDATSFATFDYCPAPIYLSLNVFDCMETVRRPLYHPHSSTAPVWL